MCFRAGDHDIQGYGPCTHRAFSVVLCRLSEGEASSGHDAESRDTGGQSSGRTSSEVEGKAESREEKRRQFEQRRKRHYNMQQALAM